VREQNFSICRTICENQLSFNAIKRKRGERMERGGREWREEGTGEKGE
jgi:hypothetical protein